MKTRVKKNWVLPSMSKPIHIETLKFCRTMARQFRDVESHHTSSGWFGTKLFADNSFSEQAGNVAMAYETVAQHIEKEIEKRDAVNKLQDKLKAG